MFASEPMTNLDNYAYNHSTEEPILLQNLIQETKTKMHAPHMLSGRLVGRFLKMLVQCSQAKNVLEIGTFTGYSALSMAEGLDTDGKLITCEMNADTADFAQGYFDRSPFGHKIQLLRGPALESIKSLTQQFELIFIDADKANYPNYYQAVLPLLPTGGIIVFDNMLFGGEVLQPERKAAEILNNLNKLLLADISVENLLLPVRDGLQIVRKR